MKYNVLLVIFIFGTFWWFNLARVALTLQYNWHTAQHKLPLKRILKN
ncbi:MAG: hypothetical protein RL757_2580 [Bacteroidota bacterium]|jgi:hypothetical protein